MLKNNGLLITKKIEQKDDHTADIRSLYKIPYRIYIYYQSTYINSKRKDQK